VKFLCLRVLSLDDEAVRILALIIIFAFSGTAALQGCKRPPDKDPVLSELQSNLRAAQESASEAAKMAEETKQAESAAKSAAERAADRLQKKDFAAVLAEARKAREEASQAKKAAAGAAVLSRKATRLADASKQLIDDLSTVNEQGEAGAGATEEMKEASEATDKAAADAEATSNLASTLAADAQRWADEAELLARIASAMESIEEKAGKAREVAREIDECSDVSKEAVRLAEKTYEGLKLALASGDADAVRGLNRTMAGARKNAEEAAASARAYAEELGRQAGELLAAGKALQDGNVEALSELGLQEMLRDTMTAVQQEAENAKAEADACAKRAEYIRTLDAEHNSNDGSEGSQARSTDDEEDPPNIDLAKVPDVPLPPETLSRPEGIVLEREPRREIAPARFGRWKQVSDDSSSDFLPGGYVTSELLFRADNILEVRHTFGADGEILQTWRIGYEWNAVRAVLILGSDPKTRPPAASLRGFRLADAGIFSSPAAEKLPIVLTYAQTKDNQIKLGKKMYKLLK